MITAFMRPITPQARREDPLVEKPDLDAFVNSGVPGFTLSDEVPPGGRPKVLYTHEGMNMVGPDRGYGSFGDLRGWVLRTRQDGV